MECPEWGCVGVLWQCDSVTRNVGDVGAKSERNMVHDSCGRSRLWLSWQDQEHSKPNTKAKAKRKSTWIMWFDWGWARMTCWFFFPSTKSHDLCASWPSSTATAHPSRRTRPGIVYLKRLNFILDQDSEQGFGLVRLDFFFCLNRICSQFVLVVQWKHFSFQCLVRLDCPSSNNTQYIIFSMLHTQSPVPTYRPYHFNSVDPAEVTISPWHTLIRTAIKNGAIFEINYVGALGGENDFFFVEADAAEKRPNAKRNWWASSQELVRVTNGRSIIVSGGIVNEADLREVLPISKTFPCQFSRFPSWHIIIIVFLLLDWLQIQHKKSRATIRNLILFELVSQLFSSASSCHRLTLSSQKHKKPTVQSSQNRNLFSLQISMWPNLRTLLKTPKCRILSQW